MEEEIYEYEVDQEDIADENKGGNCFSCSGRMVLDHYIQGNHNIRLVYWLCVGARRIEGDSISAWMG